MKEIRIKLDFSHGPIWKDRYDVLSDKWLTGVDVIDNDRALAILNDEAEKEYSSLYSFDGHGNVIFNQEGFNQKKNVLSSLVQTIILRMNSLNDGTFEVINEEKALEE